MAAVNRAQAAGLSLGQIRSQAAAEGIQFGERAANVFRQDAQIQSITDTFRQQMDAMNRAREQELAQMRQQFKIESERMRREQERRMVEQQKAAQVQMANAARAGVEGELKLGTGRTGRGVEAFKRRLKITPSTAQGLAISTANKPAGALNV
jgi:transcriptional regulator with AAA-type ATPase domain